MINGTCIGKLNPLTNKTRIKLSLDGCSGLQVLMLKFKEMIGFLF
jgi:hypothetical protein